jgi:hypothetical protein
VPSERSKTISTSVRTAKRPKAPEGLGREGRAVWEAAWGEKHMRASDASAIERLATSFPARVASGPTASESCDAGLAAPMAWGDRMAPIAWLPQPVRLLPDAGQWVVGVTQDTHGQGAAAAVGTRGARERGTHGRGARPSAPHWGVLSDACARRTTYSAAVRRSQ